MGLAPHLESNGMVDKTFERRDADTFLAIDQVDGNQHAPHKLTIERARRQCVGEVAA
jgi:hypothetical protein